MFTSLGNVPGPQLIPVHLTKPGPPGDSGGEPELVKLPASQCLKQCVCGRQHRDSAALFDTEDTSATTHVHPRYPTASLTMQAHSTVEPVACLAGTLASARNASTRHVRCSFPSYGSTLEPPGQTSAFGMSEFAASSALANTTLAHSNAARLNPGQAAIPGLHLAPSSSQDNSGNTCDRCRSRRNQLTAHCRSTPRVTTTHPARRGNCTNNLSSVIG